jgi:hypothetical protein
MKKNQFWNKPFMTDMLSPMHISDFLENHLSDCLRIDFHFGIKSRQRNLFTIQELQISPVLKYVYSYRLKTSPYIFDDNIVKI